LEYYIRRCGVLLQTSISNSRLATLRQQLQSELVMMLVKLVETDDSQLKQIFQEFNSVESALADDFLKFKENTTDAVWSLRLADQISNI